MISAIHTLMTQYASDTQGPCAGLQIPSIPLHEAMIQILGKMQETIYSSRVISVWDFLHVIENIYDARISRSQHDAHELLQLILETLLREYTALRKAYQGSQPAQDCLAEDGMKEFEEFPFASEVASSLRCMRCGKTSSMNYYPMMILSLALPEAKSVSLETLLKRNESEVIEDYSCLVCQVKYILATKDELIKDPRKLELVDELRERLDTLLINDDLQPEIQEFIDSYPGMKTPQMKSIVHRELNIIKPPKILIIHLSRSIFQDTQAWRNSCDVLFNDELEVKVDNNQLAEYKRKEEEEHISSEIEIEEMSMNPSYNPTLTSVSKASTEHLEETTENLSASDSESVDEGAQEEDYEEDTENSDSSIHIHESRTRRKKKTIRHYAAYTPPSKAATESSGDSSLTAYDYGLRSMIRHMGSHSMGHYECYRKKPMYYKSRATGEYYRKFPELSNYSHARRADIISAMINLDLNSSIPETPTTDEITGLSDFSSVEQTPHTPEVVRDVPKPEALDRSPSARVNRATSISKFRSRVSSLVGVGGPRPRSLSTAGNGSPTTSPTSPIASQISPTVFRDPFGKKPKKDKKLASCVKNPYWKISDDKVNETPFSSVLNDNAAVYMLFYERKDI
ncbi:DEKNAAC103248 [Brettanomyces naardenensis]|uniref:DEKNAAC103248 n=1 Tax=Brettanomyces naardenensis TaxID=13370 RepID=A0A448YN08_BRENA|nr:DEKNAAC103248 [Brettanomyces naardenensis]